MNLIGEVARLKELAKKEASATYKQAGDEYGYECAVLNAAPKLLDVLGEIRAGDASMLQSILDDIHEREEYPGQAYFATELLHRYRDMAAKMEANR